MSAISRSSVLVNSVAFFALRPRLAPGFDSVSDSTEAALGGRPGFFLIMTSGTTAAGAAFFNSTEGALAGDLDAITNFSFVAGFWVVDLGGTAGTAFAGFALATGLAADGTGFLVF
ncbi:hypothetical protein SBP18_07945 [Rhodoferax ferrireducens]|uniref:hypothetical protein n=1 Tax=Rhodoferax ferrireducens TaxID=192843 RepID=UPI00298D99F1|nr:hypothetical protein [Rhodoferax ferrireducens]WPC68422.1 hypothetical protein SBP18_07945 [Rhodoferax ferrireducens]